jgi:hypothetical protein
VGGLERLNRRLAAFSVDLTMGKGSIFTRKASFSHSYGQNPVML